jgi:rhamnose transport system substrate-binding protein
MTWDAGVETGGRLLHVCPSRDEVLATVWLQLLCDAISGEGEFAILSTTEEAPNQNRWIDAIRRSLETDKFKGLHLRKIVYGGDIADLSHAKALALIKALPDLKAILGLTGVGLAAAAEAIESSGQVGRIYATGLGYPSEITPFVDRRVVKSFAVWNMIDLGYTAAYLAHGLATGEIKARVGETAVVGRLGPMTIESGLEVVMAEPRIYDATNVHAAARVF